MFQSRNNTRQIIEHQVEKLRKDNILANESVFVWIVSE